jgi:hypothetical protein
MRLIVGDGAARSVGRPLRWATTVGAAGALIADVHASASAAGAVVAVLSAVGLSHWVGANRGRSERACHRGLQDPRVHAGGGPDNAVHRLCRLVLVLWLPAAWLIVRNAPSLMTVIVVWLVTGAESRGDLWGTVGVVVGVGAVVSALEMRSRRLSIPA